TLRLAHDVDAAARHRAHKTFALELGHGFAHRRAANAEILRQLALVKADVIAAAVDVHCHDCVLQRGVGFVLEARRHMDGCERGMRRQRCARGSTTARNANATGVTVSATHDWYTICQTGGQAQPAPIYRQISLLCPKSRFTGPAAACLNAAASSPTG